MSGEYYLGLKRKEIPTPAATQINLRTFCSGIPGGQFTETESRWWVPGADRRASQCIR